jgi:hypothetical protein
MGRQISFYLCDVMRTAIQTESQRIDALVVTNYSSDVNAIQFSDRFGDDDQQGRLWTESPDPTHYNILCHAVKRFAEFDRATGLWVKNESREQFEAYKNEKEKRLAELLEKNRMYARDVLGASHKKPEG